MTEAAENTQPSGMGPSLVIAAVSHELRNSLSVIAGWVELMRAAQLDQSTQTRALEIVEQHTRVLSKLASDLMDASNATLGRLTLTLTEVDLTTLVESCVEAARPAIQRKNIQLELQLGQLGVVRVDAERIRQAVNNLLANAVKFTPDGGRIQIESAALPEHLSISVTDSGIGIPPEFMALIFQPFQRHTDVAQRISGVGLGLSIVKQIVELHGGVVRAESAGENRGATFRITLPLCCS